MRRSMKSGNVLMAAALILAVIVIVVAGYGDAADTERPRDPFGIKPVVSDFGEVTPLERMHRGVRDPFARELPEPVDDIDDPIVVPPPDGEPIVVEAVISDLCWLDIYQDGSQVLRANVAGGQTMTFSGMRMVRFEQVGREWAVTVSLNGHLVGRLSELAPQLVREPMDIVLENKTVRITLDRRYPSRVLVGLQFTVISE